MRGRTFTIVVALLLAVVFVVTPRARAQSGLTYTSGIQVQNLTAETAAIQIDFYDESTGAIVPSATISGETLGPNANKTYFPLSKLATGFKGSAVVTSDKEVAAITNLLSSDGTYAGSATGLTAGSTNVGLPLIMRGNSGFDTFFSVQNAGGDDATVTITYKPGTAGNAPAPTTVTIKPGASKTFEQGTNTALGDKFIGSATITSNQPVVAMVSQVGIGAAKALLMYDGFNAGSTKITAPLIAAQNSGFYTGWSIQNVGTAAANVTVTYGANTINNGFAAPAPEVFSLAAGAGRTSIQNGGVWTNRYVGSATVTSDQPLVMVVNQLQAGSQLGTAYEGVNATSGVTNAVSAPLIMANNSGYFTGVQCQNLGAAAATITVDYVGDFVGGGTPTNDVRSGVAAGNSVTIIQSAPNFPADKKFVGSANITADQPISCLVNQVRIGTTGDTFLTYNAINY